MKKPTMNTTWQGTPGNKWKQYCVTVDGRPFYHQSKTTALRQYNAAMRIYKKRG